MDVEARLKELEGRLQVLEDQEKIRECLSRYSFNADLGRSEEYVNNYTADGVIDLSPTMKWSGKEQLTDFIASPAGGHKAIEGRCQHTSMDYFIRVDGDQAWAGRVPRFVFTQKRRRIPSSHMRLQSLGFRKA